MAARSWKQTELMLQSLFNRDSSSMVQVYNLVADLPVKPPPSLHPKTLNPVMPENLSPLSPEELIRQEAIADKFVDIPDEVVDSYRLWRPTPWMVLL
ncbi:Tryptophan synthase beta chain 2, partial [Linum perenne]